MQMVMKDRFSGVSRVYGESSLTKLWNSHAMVIGLGGVGSWAAEALVRTGVGRVTLVDYDEVCVSNTNRQLHTMTSTVGKLKVNVLAERFKDISPDCNVRAVTEAFCKETFEQILSEPVDVVVDCVDRLRDKILLLQQCYERKISVVTVGGSGGKKNPAQIRVADLNQTEGDRLLYHLRRRLRERHQFPERSRAIGIPAVFSTEKSVKPDRCAPGAAMDCNTGFGALTFVTGTFGFFAAQLAIEKILSSPSELPSNSL